MAKSPKFCLKFFFQQKSYFLKIFAEILLKSQRGDQRKHFWETFLDLVQKNFLWSPLRFSLKFLKKSRGAKFLPWSPFEIFYNFSRGATSYLHSPLAKPSTTQFCKENILNLISRNSDPFIGFYWLYAKERYVSQNVHFISDSV